MFFFFKQKTAYELRISDWSSDVCSSDLSDKTLAVDAFIPCAGIDHAYFDKPYYLAPSGAVADEAFSLLREGMRRNSVAALARTVLFRRVRTVLIRAHGDGMIANTLNFDYEVRSAEEDRKSTRLNSSH